MKSSIFRSIIRNSMLEAIEDRRIAEVEEKFKQSIVNTDLSKVSDEYLKQIRERESNRVKVHTFKKIQKPWRGGYTRKGWD